jgi:hypothetical protein
VLLVAALDQFALGFAILARAALAGGGDLSSRYRPFFFWGFNMSKKSDEAEHALAQLQQFNGQVATALATISVVAAELQQRSAALAFVETLQQRVAALEESVSKLTRDARR